MPVQVDNPADGRSKLVSLTSEGEAMVKIIKPTLDTELAAILGRLTLEELRQLADLLQKIYEAVLGQDGRG